MRKILCLLSLVLTFHLGVFAQKTETLSKEAQVTAEVRTALASRLQLSSETIEKIIPIENEFHAAMASIQLLGDISLKEKEKKLSSAHVSRREKLMAIPLTGRQMEDVIELVESIRRKNKL